MGKRTAIQQKPEISHPNNPVEKPSSSSPGLGDAHPLNDIIGAHEGEVGNVAQNHKL